MCVSLEKCFLVWKQWCVQWCMPHSSSAQDIISQSPGLMERDEWWGLYLPAVRRDRGGEQMMRVCVLMSARPALCLAWPPNTWDHELWQHSKTQLIPFCYKNHTRNELWTQSCLPSKKKNLATNTICFIMHHICRKVDYSGTSCSKSEVCLLSGQTPITGWYIKNLTSTWSSLMAFGVEKKTEQVDKWSSGLH